MKKLLDHSIFPSEQWFTETFWGGKGRGKANLTFWAVEISKQTGHASTAINYTTGKHVKLSARMRAEETAPPKNASQPKTKLIPPELSLERAGKKPQSSGWVQFVAQPQLLFKDLTFILWNSSSSQQSCQESWIPLLQVQFYTWKINSRCRVLVHLQNTNCSLSDVHFLKFPPAVHLWVNMEGALSSKPLPMYLPLLHCHIHSDTGGTMQ